MKDTSLTLLGIETSCDETAAAVVRRHGDGSGEILSNKVLSQISEHAPFGGVVPEIAARAHIEHLDTLIDAALEEAGLADFNELDAIAATAGPGLIGGILVGLTMAKGICLAQDLPLLAVNHLEGHALTPGLSEGLRPPYLLLLISGGHTQLLAVEDVGVYKRYGTTIDDAIGEAFDKTAKLLGLGYPGGPAVETMAVKGDPHRFDFPTPLKDRPGCDFSFSGLKTATRQLAQRIAPLDDKDIADICAGFQRSVVDTLCNRVRHAAQQFKQTYQHLSEPVLVAAGGVAANKAIHDGLSSVLAELGFRLSAPPANMCTDNAAMIAWAGAERLALGHQDPLDTAARARWPLDNNAKPAPYAGVKA